MHAQKGQGMREASRAVTLPLRLPLRAFVVFAAFGDRRVLCIEKPYPVPRVGSRTIFGGRLEKVTVWSG